MIDFTVMLRDLRDAGFDGWLMVELDGTAQVAPPAQRSGGHELPGLDRGRRSGEPLDGLAPGPGVPGPWTPAPGYGVGSW